MDSGASELVTNQPQAVLPLCPNLTDVPEEPGVLLKRFADHIRRKEKSGEVISDANGKLRIRLSAQQRKLDFPHTSEVATVTSQCTEAPIKQSVLFPSSRQSEHLSIEVEPKSGPVAEAKVKPLRHIVPTVISETPSEQQTDAFASASVISPEIIRDQQSSLSQQAFVAVSTSTPTLSVDELSKRHTAALLHVWRDSATPPSSFLDGVNNLLVALTPVPTTEAEQSLSSLFPPPGASLVSYSRSVLIQLNPILCSMPAPLCELFGSVGITKTKPCTLNRTASFPTGSFTPEHPIPGVAPLLPADTDSVPAIPRLRSNLEVVWDQFVILHRKFRGDIATAQPGSLDQLEALRAVAALHPANADGFSARFVSFMTRSVRTPSNAPDRLRRLDERMRGGVGNVGGAGNGDRDFGRGSYSRERSSSARSANSTSGVVLHRAPRLVRDAFANEHPEQLFFLDFVTSVDSARLNGALTPRLTSGISWAISSAACATSCAAFTDAVLEARLFAKLLSAIQHGANWPHSAESLSGAAPPAAAAAAATLPSSVRALRAKPHAASWYSILNVSRLIQDSVISREIPAVVASLAVADSIIRFAAVDPVARDTQWYRDAITALVSVTVLDKDKNPVPFARVFIGDLIATPGVLPDDGLPQALNFTPIICAEDAILSVIDARFLRAVIPSLDKLRQTCASVVRGHRVIPRSSARRITPLQTDDNASKRQSQIRSTKSKATGLVTETEAGLVARRRIDDPKIITDNDQGSTLDLLQQEFFARIDGRIRELVSVVAAANDDNSLPAQDAFISVIKILYPNTSPTVASVAAQACLRRASCNERNVNDVGRDNKTKETATISLERSLLSSSLGT